MKKGKKKATKASKRRILLFGSVSLLFIAYFFVIAVRYTYKIYQLEKEETELSSYLSQIKEDEDELVKEIEKLNDPEYLARYARENYFYSKDGEYIIRIDDPENEKEIITEDYNFVNRYTIGAISLLGVFLLMIIRKIK